MAIPSSDRKRRPFLLSLSLFLLVSALLVLLFILLDPSPGTLAFLPSRLSGSAPSFPPPLLPKQQSPATILNPESAPQSRPAGPVADTPGAKAEVDTAARQSDFTADVESNGNRDPPRTDDNNGGAPDGTASGGVVAAGDDDNKEGPVQVRWETCRVGRGVSAADYIPCLDNVRTIKALRSRRHMEHRERHCPVAPRPRCLVPLPAGYRTPVLWPRSRDMIWYNNVPHPKLVEYKKDQNWVTRSSDYLVFPGGGTQFKDGVGRYIQFIEQIMPNIQWGTHTRTVLDVGCGVASFGGKPLLELNRVLRPGGYFIWSATPVYRREKRFQDDWNAMVTLTKSMCWRTVVKSQDVNGIGVVIYQKPISSFCYAERKSSDPPLCSESDRSRFPWYAPLDICFLASAVSSSDEKNNWPVPWPERLNVRYASVPNGSYTSNKEKFDADTKYWKHVLSEVYFNDFPLNWSSIRNVMDMNAGFGGFAAALIDRPLWVMNVVPIGAPDTLPVILNRGLIGAYHDWCESFNTYPRTYDLLYMSNLVGSHTKRCHIIDVAAEIDRILRPGRWFVLKDTMEMIKKMRSVLKFLHYETVIVQHQFLIATKSFWRPGKSAPRSG